MFACVMLTRIKPMRQYAVDCFSKAFATKHPDL